MSALDLSKIKDAAAREHVRSGPNEYPIAHHMRRDEDRALLLAAVPDLLAEIERLKIHVARMRDLVAAAREHIDADRIATAYAAGFTCLVCTRTSPTREGFEHAEGCVYRVMKDGAS